MSLLSLQSESRGAALQTLSQASGDARQLEQYNDGVRNQAKARKSAGVGTALATGLAVGGPAGWAIGGVMTALSLF